MKIQLSIYIALLFGASLYAQSESGVVINGVKWATCNIDDTRSFAASPESRGKLFQWSRETAWTAESGEIGKAWQTFPDDQKEWTLNNPFPAGWRAPNAKEWERLLDKSKVKAEWTKQNGVDGMKFIDIDSGNSIFLPAVGERDALKGTFKNGGTVGNYWGYTKVKNTVYGLTFNAKKFQSKRFPDLDTGYSLRCVHEDESPYLASEKAKPLNREIKPGITLGDALGRAAEESIIDLNKQAKEQDAREAEQRRIAEEAERAKAERLAEAERRKEENLQKAEAARVEKERLEKIAKEKLAANGATVNIKGVNWATKNLDKIGAFVVKQEDSGKYYGWGSNKYYYNDPGAAADYAKGMEWLSANSPCPAGYRLPTFEEMKKLNTAEKKAFTLNNVKGTLFIDNGNYLFIPDGLYWSATGMNSADTYSHYMSVSGSSVYIPEKVKDVTAIYQRHYTMNVRCVK